MKQLPTFDSILLKRHDAPASDPAAPLTILAAKALTTRIRESFIGALDLFVEAHKRKAWQALGYKSWSEYVKTEFDFSRQRGYQLLEHGQTMKLLEGVSTFVDKPECEGQTRPMNGMEPEEKKKAWKRAAKAANGQQPSAAQVTAAIHEMKSAKATVVATQPNLAIIDTASNHDEPTLEDLPPAAKTCPHCGKPI